jgi:hypothetical protein
MKTHVLTVSRYFPATHPKKGEPTFFVEKIFNAMGRVIPCGMCINERLCQNRGHCLTSSMQFNGKLHTIRANYSFWKKRINEVNEGNAILSIRYWSGKPFDSKQVEICQLNKYSGCGVQKVDGFLFHDLVIRKNIFSAIVIPDHEIAKNDGLSLQDFKDWFKGHDLTKSMALIQFTKFRY